MDIAESKEQIRLLVESYESQITACSSSKYKEAQLRVDFINPLLKSFGWDLENTQRFPQYLREVIQEPSVDVEVDEELLRKNPDYALRIGGNVKCFVEVKKPVVDILTDKKSCFQLRRYGWNAELAASLLTNFTNLSIYDCGVLPSSDDESFRARIRTYHYKEYYSKFDEIFNLLSKKGVSEDNLASLCDDTKKIEHIPFDAYFLKQIEQWRLSLGQAIILAQPPLTNQELNYIVQKLLNRIIFLRICEDRTQEIFNQLKQISSYSELKELFHKAESRYNSGLFDFVEDKLTDAIDIDSSFLLNIFKDLYYPDSPYKFSVLGSSVLSRIYEIFLGKKLVISKNKVELKDKPDVVETNGIVPTPDYIVSEIIHRTIKPLLENKTPAQVSAFRFADICCGSGTFLVALFNYLINWHLDYYSNHKESGNFYNDSLNEPRLSLESKQKILANNIFGVDIDPNAVEVTSFNLYIKLLDGESADSITEYALNTKNKALPNLSRNIKCGNSLIDNNFFKFRKESALDSDEFELINPLNWEAEFSFINESGGFDAIIGNPPYIRIQNIVKYSPHEVAYYQSKVASFTTSHKDNFDKYYLFIERSLSLLNKHGRLGYIIPHKFTLVKSGCNLRKLISQNKYLDNLIHFGTCQVFSGRSTYTCILILDKSSRNKFTLVKVEDLLKWQSQSTNDSVEFKSNSISEYPWVLHSNKINALLKQMKGSKSKQLSEIADIYVGLQTSADSIYIIKPEKESAKFVYFEKDRKKWKIEKEILRPCIYDLTFSPFVSPNCNAYMIFPYSFGKTGVNLIPLSILKKKYPACFEYLLSNKSKLRKRNMQNAHRNNWYQFGRSQSLTKFNGTPKLIWPVLSLGANYTYDSKDVLFTGGGNGPYYALRVKKDEKISLYYLLGILSHPILEFSVKSKASTFRGGYYSHGKEYLSGLPIAIPDFADRQSKNAYDEIVETTIKIISLQNKLSKTKTPHQQSILQKQSNVLKQELFSISNTLYSLSNADVNLCMQDITLTANNDE